MFSSMYLSHLILSTCQSKKKSYLGNAFKKKSPSMSQLSPFLLTWIKYRHHCIAFFSHNTIMGGENWSVADARTPIDGKLTFESCCHWNLHWKWFLDVDRWQCWLVMTYWGGSSSGMWFKTPVSIVLTTRGHGYIRKMVPPWQLSS